jgi:hypothetical protein
MAEILSLWRSPLDQVGASAAEILSKRQPRCSIGPGEDFSAMTIYNFEYYYLATSPANTGTALTSMFAAMNPGPYASGGLAFIPQLNYNNVVLSSAPFVVPDQCNIVGSGGGGAGKLTSFYHFTIDYTAGSLFLSCTGNYTSGGRYFRSLAFKGVTTSLSIGDTCIYADTANGRAYNCTFTDIPTAFNAQGDGCALQQCTIDYNAISGTAGAPIKAIIIAGAQCAVMGPGELQQRPQSDVPSGPSYCTCVSIEGAKQTIIADTHFVDWNIGIDFGFAAGAIDTDIRNCEVQCAQTALSIMLPPSGATTATSGIKVTCCMLAKSNDASADDPMGHPVVVIDPQGNNNGLLTDVTLLECTVVTMGSSTILGQHGLNIVGGSNIKIIGGTYSNNSSHGGAGIAITGACGDVQIIGANLQPTYPWTGTTPGSSLNNQQYGLLISGGPTGTVYVSDCDLTGYTSTTPYQQQAVLVTGTAPHELLISNCPGYNDQSTSISSTPPTSPASASSPGAGGTPYFGPSVFIFSNSSPLSLHVFGQTILTSFGIIFLPSPYDSFNFVLTAPTMFLWIGR